MQPEHVIAFNITLLAAMASPGPALVEAGVVAREFCRAGDAQPLSEAGDASLVVTVHERNLRRAGAGGRTAGSRSP